MKTIGYLRVSTPEQDLEKNKGDILKLANEKRYGPILWVEEIISGRISWKKREIAEVIDQLGDGDNLIVSEFSRLGRSMLECMEILSVATEKGVNVYAVKGNWQLDGSIQSKVIAMAFAMAAEIERDLISQRTKEALRARKEAGKTLGRPKGSGKSKLDDYHDEVLGLKAIGVTNRAIAKKYGITDGTVSRWMKKNYLKSNA